MTPTDNDSTIKNVKLINPAFAIDENEVPLLKHQVIKELVERLRSASFYETNIKKSITADVAVMIAGYTKTYLIAQNLNDANAEIEFIKQIQAIESSSSATVTSTFLNILGFSSADLKISEASLNLVSAVNKIRPLTKEEKSVPQETNSPDLKNQPLTNVSVASGGLFAKNITSKIEQPIDNDSDVKVIPEGKFGLKSRKGYTVAD